MVLAGLVVKADVVAVLAMADGPVAGASQLLVRVVALHASLYVCDGVYAYTCPYPEHNYQLMQLRKRQLIVKD